MDFSILILRAFNNPVNLFDGTRGFNVPCWGLGGGILKELQVITNDAAVQIVLHCVDCTQSIQSSHLFWVECTSLPQPVQKNCVCGGLFMEYCIMTATLCDHRDFEQLSSPLVISPGCKSKRSISVERKTCNTPQNVHPNSKVRAFNDPCVVAVLHPPLSTHIKQRFEFQVPALAYFLQLRHAHRSKSYKVGITLITSH